MCNAILSNGYRHRKFWLKRVPAWCALFIPRRLHAESTACDRFEVYFKVHVINSFVFNFKLSAETKDSGCNVCHLSTCLPFHADSVLKTLHVIYGQVNLNFNESSFFARALA